MFYYVHCLRGLFTGSAWVKYSEYDVANARITERSCKTGYMLLIRIFKRLCAVVGSEVLVFAAGMIGRYSAICVVRRPIEGVSFTSDM